VHRLLTDELKVAHLRAIIGFSMGAEQAFQWAVSYPAFADRIVATSGTAKCYPHGYVRLESEINAIATDPAFKNGDYTTPPTKGIEAFATDLDRLALFSGMVAQRTLARRRQARHHLRAGSQRIPHQLHPGGDANDLILQMRTWERHDVGATPGFNGDVERALRSIKTPILYMPSETDPISR